MNLAELSNKYQNDLAQIYDKDEANAIFKLVVQSLLNINNAAYVLHKADVLSPAQELKLTSILSKLSQGIPVQYVLGATEFYGLKFNVNASVLIPRPETEELVDWVINACQGNTNINLLDIGTGSGCIAISLKKHLPSAKVSAIDIATDTLVTAQRNAELNKVDVNFLLDDILKPSDELLQQSFDVIVSNPPYIKEDEKPAMHNNVLQHEPHRALFVSNEKPLVFYKAIANFAITNLAKGGKLFFEINEYLGAETVEMLYDKSFINIELKKDMQGKDRMVLAYKA